MEGVAGEADGLEECADLKISQFENVAIGSRVRKGPNKIQSQKSEIRKVLRWCNTLIHKCKNYSRNLNSQVLIRN